MNGYQTRFSKLCPANGENAFLQIHIFCLQVARLADTQTRHSQQTQEAMVGQTSQTVSRWQLPCRLKQLPDLTVAIQVRARTPGPMWQQAVRRDLGLGVMSTPVACKAANETEPPGPFRWARSFVLLCPFHRQSYRDVCRTALVEKRGEINQSDFSVPQFESQTAAHLHVVLDRFTPWLHCAPPGQGKANVESEARSTFA
jgi:hypothetical protein